jgi:hypothetical protein
MKVPSGQGLPIEPFVNVFKREVWVTGVATTATAKMLRKVARMAIITFGWMVADVVESAGM